MADIKTRDIVKGTVKTLDRSAVATERMKSATVRTKNAAEQSVNGNEVSAQEYGANRVESAVEIATAEGVRQFNKQGKNGFRNAKKNAQKVKENYNKLKDLKKTNKPKKATEQVAKTAKNTTQQTAKTVKATGKGSVKTAQAAGKGTVKTAQNTVKTAKATGKVAVKTAETTVKTAKATAQATAKATKAAAAAAKAAVKATIAAIKIAVKAIVAAVKLAIAAVKAIAAATQVERVKTTVNYVADSFLAFADVSYSEITGTHKNNIVRQIKDSLDNSVVEIEIHTSQNATSEYTEIDDNKCVSQFIKKDDLILMESVCKIGTEADVYYLVVYSDFTETQKQCGLFWNSYGIVVFIISVISGLLILASAKKITKPLSLLTKVSDEVALGNYGKKVDVKSSDYEITALSESFNSMSLAIEQKIKEIREESEKRNIFVADFTHEMKTPMTAIIGYAQMLRSYDLNTTEKDQAAEAIYNEAKRLEKLSLQLLDLYVFQNEQIEMEKLNLLTIGEQLKATLKHLSEKYDVLFSIDFDDETICANGVLLLSLLYNLVDNAFKASEPQTTVKIYSKSSNDIVRVFVEDKGRGIAKENIKLLTEPFYREDKSRSRKFGGAGLGLSLCKEIATLHGTELSFESEKGKGTTVSFNLEKGGEEGE